MNKDRIKAFTIMEVTVAMLLTAVVIGITYTAYSIISRSYMAYHHKNDDLAVLIRVDDLLKKDFARAYTVLKSEKGIDFKDSTGIVKYEIDSDVIVRTSIKIDTFRIKTQTANFFFENQILNDVSPVAELNRVDELELIITFQDQQIPYHYRKLYSSVDLIERKSNAVN